MNDLTWRVGDVDVARIEESVLGLPTKVLVPDVTQDHLDATAGWIEPYFDEPNEDGEIMLRLSIHSFVIRSGDTTIVVENPIAKANTYTQP